MLAEVVVLSCPVTSSALEAIDCSGQQAHEAIECVTIALQFFVESVNLPLRYPSSSVSSDHASHLSGTTMTISSDKSKREGTPGRKIVFDPKAKIPAEHPRTVTLSIKQTASPSPKSEVVESCTDIRMG
ncbi:hypothetical protein P152DRAFT_298924 [Eremomyces bilateralis CBS 781.70]|uniref:Uncharacterized protein n=1 Tax=Eremomyces bilateralis CBS 781.70 TaxID=1392243 RepID=A0A6G1G7T5_9PEZI|nr:uncharacterized protein P152DRAFT_298924 [Eremomyces bilateralis CBS 781.70]KAF1813950.1 hypothetical protein P152DRAFT_298924 [Eremomyces bilateralis CBS 781.70]